MAKWLWEGADAGPLRPEPDGALADWVFAGLDHWRDGTPVAGVVPRGFPAVARVLHPWDRWTGSAPPYWTPTTWAAFAAHYGGRVHPEVQAEALAPPERWQPDGFGEPLRGQLTPTVAQALVEVLEPATSTPHDALFALWDGHGDEPPERWPGAALVGDDHRRHIFLRGPVAAALSPLGTFRDRLGAQLWWPADRAWLVASEIDFAWTYVAGGRQVVDAVLAHPDLEVVPSAYDHRGDIDGDRVHGPVPG